MGAKTSKGRYVVKEDYTAPLKNGQEENDERFSIKVGDVVDRLKMPKDSLMSEENVFYIRNLETKKKDYAPSCILGKKGTLDEHSWYFGKIGRSKAMTYLRRQYNMDGAYLVRQSDTDRGENVHVLSVKNYSENEDRHNYKHYKITFQSGQYFLFENRPSANSQKFSSLAEFVEAAQKKQIPRLESSRVVLKAVVQRPRPNIISVDDEDEEREKWQMEKTDITRGDKLSSGNFGIVYKGNWRGTRDVAIKTLITRPTGDSDKLLEEFWKEVQILTQLHHPHLVQVFGFVIDSEEPMMVMELLEGGDLRNHLVKKGQDIDFDTIHTFCENIAAGMKKLESMHIVHRDLAARNVMLDGYMQAKVGDFGLARQGDIYENAGAKFPYQWTAPEAARSRSFNHKSDVWSFGIVLWEIFALGETPYKNFDPVETIVPSLLSGYRLDMPKKVAAKHEELNKMHNIMLKCWLKEPKSRPTFDSIWDTFRTFETSNDYDYCSEEFMRDNEMHSVYEGGKKKKRKTRERDRAEADGSEGGDKKGKKKKKKKSKSKE